MVSYLLGNANIPGTRYYTIYLLNNANIYQVLGIMPWYHTYWEIPMYQITDSTIHLALYIPVPCTIPWYYNNSVTGANILSEWVSSSVPKLI